MAQANRVEPAAVVVRPADPPPIVIRPRLPLMTRRRFVWIAALAFGAIGVTAVALYLLAPVASGIGLLVALAVWMGWRWIAWRRRRRTAR